MKHNFKFYCKDYENIENYCKAAADNFIGWECHHRLETHNSDGERREVDIFAAELQSLGMYWNRPSSELIFMKHSEHRTLHQKGKQKSEETKNKISESKKGKYTGEKNPMYGKHFSEEHKMKIGAAKKGTRWYNNGEKCVRAKERPEGFIPGRLLIK